MNNCEHEWEGYFSDLLPISPTEVEALCNKCKKRFIIKTPLFNIPENTKVR